MYIHGMYIHVYDWNCVVTLVIDPPATTITEVSDRCANDFTMSWTIASHDEGLSYPVIIFLDGVTVVPMMNNFQNFLDLMPNTTYNVSVASRFDTCVGICNTRLITTLALEACITLLCCLILYIVCIVFNCYCAWLFLW